MLIRLIFEEKTINDDVPVCVDYCVQCRFEKYRVCHIDRLVKKILCKSTR